MAKPSQPQLHDGQPVAGGKPPRISLRDIARECGVSASTVSAVLHESRGNNSRFSPDTRSAVLETAQKLGYRANRVFRNFSRRRHGVLGIAHAPDGFVPHPTLIRMSEAAAERDYMLVFSHIEKAQPVFIKEDAVDGLVLFGDRQEELGMRSEELEIPTLHVNCNRRHVPGSITYGEEDAMRQAVEHLAETGREQVLFLLPHSEVKERHYSEEERWDGIRQNSQRLNLRQPVRYRMKTWFETDWRCSTETYEPAVEELTRLLRDRPDCDAVIVDFRVMGIALSEALRRLGREMPRDIGVIQINPFNTLDIGFPATTTIGLDFERLGEVIIETLADGIDKGSWGEPITFPLTLYPRDTT